jgi:hypothetical protein
VEAEELPEIAESFEIEAVPTFIILRGHALLNRISGADAAALTKAFGGHVGTTPSVTPLSKSTFAPAKADDNISGSDDLEEKEETQEDLNKRLRGLMNNSTVVLFMKGSPDAPRCGFSRKIVGLLREQNVEFSHFDILSDESVRQGKPFAFNAG